MLIFCSDRGQTLSAKTTFLGPLGTNLPLLRIILPHPVVPYQLNLPLVINPVLTSDLILKKYGLYELFFLLQNIL